LTVNGNVSNFQITNNLIHDDNNIGIDMIGGEAGVFGLPDGTQGLPVARNGLCSRNTVYNIHANYGGGYAGGIYVDGGQNINISDNVSYQNDMGLEVGAENHGYVTSGVTVSDNLLYNNFQGGLVFGGPIDKLGPDPTGKTVGRVQNCTFVNNTVYNSDRSDTGQGALMIQWASNNLVANNIFVASANNVLLDTGSYAGSNVNNTLDNNLYYAPGGPANALFTWGGLPGVKANQQTYSWTSWSNPTTRKATGEDVHSLFGNPLFVNAAAANFHLTAASPAIAAGSSKSGWYAAVDFDGTTRDLPPEIGAYEYEPPGSTTYYVSTTGNDANPGTFTLPFATIQHALDLAVTPGDTVDVRGGTYKEQIALTHSGAAGAPITLQAYPGEHPILNGTTVPSPAFFNPGNGNSAEVVAVVMMTNVSYVNLIGFEIAKDNGVAAQAEAYGVFVQGSGSHVLIQGNIIHDITGLVIKQGQDNVGYGGAGIHVYGTSLARPYDNVIIDGNTIFNCQPGDSETETLTINGNVTNFQIINNTIHDDNNIGIDMIGGEANVFNLNDDTQNLPVARNGVCSHNTIYNIHANYGNGQAAGIYVDGGQNITISDNVSYQNDYGLQVGAEWHGYVASGITASDNLLYNNRQGGLIFGGLADKDGPDPTGSTVGRVENSRFINNTVYNSDTLGTGYAQGQLQIQWASNNVVANNIFVASADNVLVDTLDYAGSNVNNVLDYNLYYAPGGAANAEFDWGGQTYFWSNQNDPSVPDFQQATGEDAHSLFGNPLFVNAGAANFHLTAASPAINRGSSKSGWYAPVDFDGTTRDLPPDIGAYEYETGGLLPPPMAVGQPVVEAAPVTGSAGHPQTSNTQAIVDWPFTLAGAYRRSVFGGPDFGEVDT
jgi:hypothetical protein